MKKSDGQILVVFNLATDLDNYLLAHTHDWICEFAKHFSFILVFSTYVGRTDLPKNCTLIQLGGGNLFGKLKAAFLSMAFMPFFILNRQSVQVFHHMSSKSLFYSGLLFKALKVQQGIWYSHSRADNYLRASLWMADFAFSSTHSSFPVKKFKRLHSVGHAVKFPEIQVSEIINLKQRLIEGAASTKLILIVGRVSPVKRIQDLILDFKGISDLDKESIRIKLIGPVHDKDYLRALLDTAEKNNLNLVYSMPKTGDDLHREILAANFMYNGMRNSVDKSALLGTSLGTPVLTQNEGLLELTGMDKFESTEIRKSNLWLKFNHWNRIIQLDYASSLTHIIQRTRILNDLSGATSRIVRIMRGVK